MKKNYATVFWENENLFSHIKITKVCFSSEDVKDTSELLDKTWQIEYETGRFQEGKIIAIGSRAKMSQLSADKAEEIANLSIQGKTEEQMDKAKKERKTTKRKVANILEGESSKGPSTREQKIKKAKNLQRNSDAVLSQLVSSQPPCTPFNPEKSINTVLDSSEAEMLPEANIGSQLFRDDAISSASGVGSYAPNLDVSVARECEGMGNFNQLTFQDSGQDNRIKKLELELKRARKEKKKLQKQLQKFETEEQEVAEEKIDLGSNILVDKSIIREIKSDFRYHPTKFLRSLMYNAGIFTLDEVAGCSVTGQKCREGQRPRLDPVKFNICKDYTIKVCKLKPATVKYMAFLKSLHDICTDARKVLKKRNNE